MKFTCFFYGVLVATLLERRVDSMALEWLLWACTVIALSRAAFTASVRRSDGWVRIGKRGWGVRWKNTRKHITLYSERIGQHRQYRLGAWLVRVLPPMEVQP